jgi:hypothetical protein
MDKQIMRNASSHWSMLLSLAVLWTGCGVTREVRGGYLAYEGYVPAETVTVTEAEGSRIDEIRTREDALPKMNQRCDLLRQLLSAEGQPGIHEYLRRRSSYICKKAEDERAVEAAAARERAERDSRLTAGAREEAASGRCLATNREYFEQWLSFINDTMKTKIFATENTGIYAFAGHQLMVLGQSGADVTVGDWLNGELHVLAFSHLPVELELVDQSGEARTRKSPVERTVGWRHHFGGQATFGVAGDPSPPEHRDSRVLMANPGERFNLRAKGDGCTLLVAFRRS